MAAGSTSAAYKKFDRELRSFTKDLVPLQVSLVQRKIALEALARFVKRSPVDKGRLRANWQASIGSPAGGTIEAEDDSESGTPTVNRGAANIAAIPPFSVIWLVNNLPYAEVWDEGLFEPPDPGPSKDPRESRKGRILVKGGFSTQSQAVEGMIAVTLEELRHMFQ